MTINVGVALPPFIESLQCKLLETPLSITEFTAVLVILKHESLFTNAFLNHSMKHPGSESVKTIRDVQKAFETLHSLLNRIDAGESFHEK